MPEPTQGPPSPDPGSPRQALIAWGLIIAALLAIIGLHSASTLIDLLSPTPAAGAVVAEAPELTPPTNLDELALFSKLAVGFKSIVGEALDGGSAGMLKSQLDGSAQTGVDRLRCAVVVAELEGPESASAWIDDLGRDLKPDDPLGDEIRRDAAIFRDLLSEDPESVDQETRDGLIARHGWFAELALSHAQADDAPERAAILKSARRVAGVLIVFSLLIISALAGGFVALVVFVVFAAAGKIRPRFGRPTRGGSVFVESFAVFVLGFIALLVVREAVSVIFDLDIPITVVIASQWLLTLAAFYPLMRGMSWANLREALGWHAGKGFLREMGAGFVAYLASIPLLGVCFLATIVLMALTSAVAQRAGIETTPPSHPAVEAMTRSGVWGIVSIYSLAVVWAPITEETLFRGALYRHLRGRHHWLVSTLVVGLVFALLHPQGIAFVPVLAGLGGVFCLMREWRGSLIAPMFVHGLHNATIMTLGLLILT